MNLATIKSLGKGLIKMPSLSFDKNAYLISIKNDLTYFKTKTACFA
jgi:hypothetical protein